MRRTKNTKRFSFKINTNDRSHQSGANTVSIIGRDYDTSGGYTSSTGDINPGEVVTMTVKEAKAFQVFLERFLFSTENK
jgi:hypothetical protein|tara:strand:- start:97 stop:333 length:237 start_codon:yes stop_codon:yes gene_type:complete